MSIYPVPLNEWFPIGDENYCKHITDFMRCHSCYTRVNYFKAWGHHSIPWGYGEVWCNEKCLDSYKIGKVDKRQRRKEKRISKKWTVLLDL